MAPTQNGMTSMSDKRMTIMSDKMDDDYGATRNSNNITNGSTHMQQSKSSEVGERVWLTT